MLLIFTSNIEVFYYENNVNGKPYLKNYREKEKWWEDYYQNLNYY